MKRMIRLVLVLIATLSLTACDISSSDADRNASANGIWSGTMSWDGGAGSNVLAMSYAGRLIVISASQGILFDGGYQVDDHSIVATAYEYWLDGAAGDYQGIVQLDGTVVEQHNLTLDFVADDGAGGLLLLDFVEQYNRDASLSYLQGYWDYFGASAAEDLVLNVDSYGGFSGQDGYGCIFEGDFERPSLHHNIYRMVVEVSNCEAYNGIYDGLATLVDGDYTADVLLMAFSNADHAFYYDLDYDGL